MSGFLCDEVTEPFQVFFPGRIAADEFLREPNRAQRQRHDFLDVPFF